MEDIVVGKMKGRKEILVSISCITYNHAPYIRQCLDGFMMQQTNFAFEVLIHDDASTDGTTEIIKEYEAKYPDIIKPLYEEENQWVKGRRGSAVFNFPRAKGKYIALCEGDDYWTDPLKLQKQVDFLEANPDFVMCSCQHKVYNENLGEYSNNWYRNIHEGVEYNLFTFINGYWFCQTLTVMLRADKFNINENVQHSYFIDAALFFNLLKKGKGYMLPHDIGVYRVHSESFWSPLSINKKLELEFFTRFEIYDGDPCYESAYFVKSQFFKPMSRIWMLKNFSIFKKALRIMIKHLGLWVTFKAVIKSILISTK